MDIADINRATMSGFMEYMLLNPEYFRQTFKLDANKRNIRLQFKELQNHGLIVAAHIPPDCECDYCCRKAQDG